MSPTHIITRLRELLGERLVDARAHSASRVYVEVEAADVPSATRCMLEDLGARFQIATGIDTPPDVIELLYHWALDAEGCVVTVRARLARSRPEIESIAALCPAAEWIEREIKELLGVEFLHHPDPRHLLLREDWPEGEFPLRRDYGP